MARPFNLLLRRCAVQLGMNIEAAQPSFFSLLNYKRVRLGVGILPHTRHLPGHFHVRFVGANAELVVLDLTGHDGLRELPDHCQLVTEVSVEGLKPLWQLHRYMATAIRGDVAGVDVHHLRGFDRGVNQVLVCRIQRMVDPEVLGPGENCSGDVEVAAKVSGVATRTNGGVDTVSTYAGATGGGDTYTIASATAIAINANCIVLVDASVNTLRSGCVNVQSRAVAGSADGLPCCECVGCC